MVLQCIILLSPRIAMLTTGSHNFCCLSHPVCPDGQEPVNCFMDPCQFASCPAFPTAVCEADYCGGCYARFFVEMKSQTCAMKTECAAVIISFSTNSL